MSDVTWKASQAPATPAPSLLEREGVAVRNKIEVSNVYIITYILF